MPVRVLTPSDAPALRALYLENLSTSMFQLSNLRDGGVEDQGQRHQGTYVGEFDAQGKLCAAIAHVWTGGLLIQAPDGPSQELLDVVRQARPDRPISSLLGPHDQVLVARDGLGLANTPCDRESREFLYDLELRAHTPHPMLSEPGVEARLAALEDLDTLVPWRAAYIAEALWQDPETIDLGAVRDAVTSAIRACRVWVLTHDSQMVACTGTNAEIPEVFQIGGVWTPSERRNRGYARAIVSHQIVEKRRQGSERAILFTDEENIAAQRTYEALGFRRIGAFGMFLGYPHAP